jgi:hypothetical protein
MPDFGTVRENEAAFDVAIAAITSGDIAWGHLNPCRTTGPHLQH